MPPRHPDRPLPRVWLMTDERADLRRAVSGLPRGAGIIFRHYRTPRRERLRLWRWLRGVAQRRGLLLVRGGELRLPGERHLHGGGPRCLTWSAHDRGEARAGVRAGARLLFVSPVYSTRSHPAAPPLGPIAAARIGRGSKTAAVALGGMTARRYARIRQLGFDGWAAIDAFDRPDQKRKAVPT